jgi:hypothetical protein
LLDDLSIGEIVSETLSIDLPMAEMKGALPEREPGVPRGPPRLESRDARFEEAFRFMLTAAATCSRFRENGPDGH